MIDSKFERKLIQIEQHIVALNQLRLLIEVPDLTFTEWEAFGLSIKEHLRNKTETLIKTECLEIIRQSCLYGEQTKTVKTTKYPDGREETTVEIEQHPPNIALLLNVLARHYPAEFDKKKDMVFDWIASGETEPPQALMDDFDAIIAKSV